MQQWNLDATGGIGTRAQLLAAGAAPHELTRAVRDGRLIRPRPGIYALPTVDELRLEATRRGARLCCLTAARSYGWWGGMETRKHIRVRPNARSAGAADSDVVVHWKRSEAWHEVWRVSPADCLRSVVRCSDEETAVAVLDTAVSSGIVRIADLPAIFEREPKWTATVLVRARPGSDSGVESIARQRLTAAGYLVEQQVAVPGVGRVDLRLDGWLFVEIDGFAFHSGREAFERDRIRDIGLAVRGGGRLRFSARQVMTEWDVVSDVIRSVMTQEKLRDTPLDTPLRRRFQGDRAVSPAR